MEKTPNHGFVPGEVFTVDLQKIGSKKPVRATLEVGEYLGRGFSSSAWEAIMDGDTKVALKYLDPGGKRAVFRDLFSKAMFGLPFPAAYFEPALVMAEGQRELLQRGLEVASRKHPGLKEVRFAQNHGHFLPPGRRKFAEVVEFVDGNPNRPLVPGSEAEDQFWNKKHHLDDVAALAETMGMKDLARQWRASTLVATLNAFSVGSGKDSKTVIHDWRPGLGVISPLPLSPGDVLSIMDLLVQGRPFSFDKVNLKKLDKFVKEHASEFQDLKGVVEELRRAQSICEKVFISPLTVWPNQFMDPEVRALRRQVISHALFSDGVTDIPEHPSIKNSDSKAMLNMALSNFPLAGTVVQKAIYNDTFRQHLKAFVKNPEYRHALNLQAVDEMLSEGKISAQHANELRNSDLAVLIERGVALLPGDLQHLTAEKDVHDLYGWIGKKVVTAVKVLFLRKDNQKWIEGQINKGLEEGDIAENTAKELKERSKDPKTISLSRDLAVTTLGSDAATKLIIQPALFATGTYFDNPALMLWATTGAGLGSLTRAGYFSFKAAANLIADTANNRETRFWKDMSVAALSTAPVIGNLAALVRMRVWEKELADYLAMRALDNITSMIPVLGGRGTLTEALVHQMYGHLTNGQESEFKPQITLKELPVLVGRPMQ